MRGEPEEITRLAQRVARPEPRDVPSRPAAKPTCGVCGTTLRHDTRHGGYDCPRIYDAPEHLALDEAEATPEI